MSEESQLYSQRAWNNPTFDEERLEIQVTLLYIDHLSSTVHVSGGINFVRLFSLFRHFDMSKLA